MLLTIQEIADRLRVDSTTVRRWIRSGALPAVLLPTRGQKQAYRIKQEDLDKILK